MSTTQQRLEQLLSDSNWSSSDKEWLLGYVESTDAKELQALMSQWHNDELQADTKIQGRISRLMWQHIAKNTIDKDTSQRAHRIHFLKTSWFRYAAAVILIIGGAAVWYQISQNTSPRHFERRDSGVRNLADIAPGGNKAVLTLADGSTIVLDNAQNGNLAQQGATNIIKLDNGQLAYQLPRHFEGATATEKSLLYNTISTPRGGQYQVVLPDGSKVWLNAASSIKFPAAFTNTTREVEVTGEAYLEVAQNAKQPFYVHTNRTTVQVLGTSFNINSYEDDPAEKTTLIEGSVKVMQHPAPSFRAQREISHNDAAGVILRSGEQAQTQSGGKITVKTINTDEVIAWKSGFFNWQDASFREVAKQIERWYDIEIKYEGAIPDIQFQGTMDRGVKLSGLRSWLNDLGITTRLEGRALIVKAR